MNSKMKIKEDLASLKHKYEVILFGSRARSEEKPNSDFDIAVITRLHDEKKNIDIQKSLFGQFDPIYDIRVFELYPIDVQITIIENHDVIFGDILEISEYFYKYRKIWKDVRHRILENQFKNHKEQIELRKRYLEIVESTK